MSKKITLDTITRVLAEDEMDGFCWHCGNIQSGVEPDARNYQCENCLEWQVYGAEETLLQYEYEN
jgi:hypothetical protein